MCVGRVVPIKPTNRKAVGFMGATGNRMKLLAYASIVVLLAALLVVVPGASDVARAQEVGDLELDPNGDGVGGVLPGPVYNDPDPGTSATITLEDAGVDVRPGGLHEAVAIEIETAARSTIVNIDEQALLNDLSAETVTFELFDDEPIEVTTSVAPSDGALDSTIYRGVSADNHAIITTMDGGVIGQFFTPEGQFGIAPLGGADLHVVFEIDRDFPNGAEPDQFPGVDNGPSGLTVQELSLIHI